MSGIHQVFGAIQNPTAIRPRFCNTDGCTNERTSSGALCGACTVADVAGRKAPKETAVDRARRRLDVSLQGVRFGTEDLRGHCKDQAARKAAYEIRDALPICTLIWGNSKAGKTALLGALANHVLDAGSGGAPAERRVLAAGLRYVSCVDLGEAKREGDLGDVPETVEICMSASLLLLDELGREANGADGKAIVFRVLDDRLRRGRPTVIASGFGLAALEEMYDIGALRRLFLDGQTPIHVKGGLSPKKAAP